MAALTMTEADFHVLVTDLATVYGWQWAHFRVARTAHGWRTAVSGPIGKGFPDLILTRERDGRMVFAELKRDGATTDADQTAVLDYLRRVARYHGWIGVHVWRPADLDLIAEVLR